MTIEDRDRFSDNNAIVDEHSSSGGTIDLARYKPLLADLDVSDEQADELLRILYDIMRMFVEIGIQPESWGQITANLIEPVETDSPRVNS